MLGGTHVANADEQASLAIYKLIHVPHSIPLGDANAITIDSASNRLIAIGIGRISAYDLKTEQLLHSAFYLAAPNNPEARKGFGLGYDVAFDARHNHIFVSVGGSGDKGSGRVQVYDGTTLAYVATLQGSDNEPLDNPGHIAVDATNDRILIQHKNDLELFDDSTLTYGHRLPP